MRHWARAIYLPPVPAKHTPASGASPLKQDNIIYLITHPKEKGYRYEDTKQKKKKGHITNVKILSPSNLSERPCF